MNIKALLPRPRTDAERKVRRELADCNTPAAIADLMATVESHESPEADMIRNILSHNLQEWNRRSTPVR